MKAIDHLTDLTRKSKQPLELPSHPLLSPIGTEAMKLTEVDELGRHEIAVQKAYNEKRAALLPRELPQEDALEIGNRYKLSPAGIRQTAVDLIAAEWRLTQEELSRAAEKIGNFRFKCVHIPRRAAKIACIGGATTEILTNTAHFHPAVTLAMCAYSLAGVVASVFRLPTDTNKLPYNERYRFTSLSDLSPHPRTFKPVRKAIEARFKAVAALDAEEAARPLREQQERNKKAELVDAIKARYRPAQDIGPR